MREPPVMRYLPDGRRLHFHDGPIDLILEAFGAPAEIEAAYRAAAKRFVTVLDELCSELPLLRSAARPDSPRPQGRVAQRMADAVAPFAARHFITPMAAVAGAVAEEILTAMTSAAALSRAYVNDGGDIALHLTAGESFAIGMIDRPDNPSLFGTACIEAAQKVRGIATSGWRGRSFSLGIADAVTVLAATAAQADAAATIVANAVNLPAHPAITRAPANEIAPDSDLGARQVTRGVGELTPAEIESALAAGAAAANELIAETQIQAAALNLCGRTAVCSAALQAGSFSAEDANPARDLAPESSALRRSFTHA
ncbi:MAG: UPF0280 family protein [Candidatus Acidiferrales bacterium]